MTGIIHCDQCKHKNKYKDDVSAHTLTIHTGVWYTSKKCKTENVKLGNIKVH